MCENQDLVAWRLDRRGLIFAATKNYQDSTFYFLLHANNEILTYAIEFVIFPRTPLKG